ncbi:hypothetical protein, partial [Xanthovirga aplysinae]|uniref:hypothetical protein n=1 Tax=Xanthovirga aplysinae TaxID=2529853 RepID=UPI0012BC7232
MKIRFLILIILILVASHIPLKAQENSQQSKLSTDLVQFFVGSWEGKGEFSSGKKIEADISFEISLDSAWLLYQHNDRPPNSYQSTSMWGIDRNSGGFVAYSFDNFKEVRHFTSNGWENNQL